MLCQKTPGDPNHSARMQRLQEGRREEVPDGVAEEGEVAVARVLEEKSTEHLSGSKRVGRAVRSHQTVIISPAQWHKPMMQQSEAISSAEVAVTQAHLLTAQCSEHRLER